LENQKYKISVNYWPVSFLAMMGTTVFFDRLCPV